MTKYIPNLNLPPNNNKNDIYNSIDIDMIIESLESKKVSSKLDLPFFKGLSPIALKSYVAYYNKEFVKNILCQAVKAEEYELAIEMLKIKIELASFCQKQELELVGDDQSPQDQV